MLLMLCPRRHTDAGVRWRETGQTRRRRHDAQCIASCRQTVVIHGDTVSSTHRQPGRVTDADVPKPRATTCPSTSVSVRTRHVDGHTARGWSKRWSGNACLTRFIAAGPRAQERREVSRRSESAASTTRVRRQRTTASRRRVPRATAPTSAMTWRHQHGGAAPSWRRVAAIPAVARRVSLPPELAGRRRPTADDDRWTVGRKLFEQEDDGKARTAGARWSVDSAASKDWVRETRSDSLTVAWTARLPYARRTPVSASATGKQLNRDSSDS